METKLGSYRVQDRADVVHVKKPTVAAYRTREEPISPEEAKMNQKPTRKPTKPYWEMTTDELHEATQEFDEEFVADKAHEMTPAMRARWERAKSKRAGAEDDAGAQTIAVHLEKNLLDKCTALAKRKRISRDALIARGLKALLAAERA
jgi:hypothetical protein